MRAIPAFALFLACAAAHGAWAATPLLAPFTLPIPSSNIPSAVTPFNSSSLGTFFVFTAPSGRVISLLPFYTQDFSRAQGADGSEILTAVSAPYFAVRIAPSEEGIYLYEQAFSPDAPPSANPMNGSFECAGGPARAGDGYAFAQNKKFTLDGKSAFWLVGENMAWPGCWPYFNGSSAYDNATGSSYMYDRFLPKLAGVGGNWIRLWIGPSLVRDVSWDGEMGSFLAMALASKVPFGTYNLEAAWRIEHVIELCRSLGIKISLVFEAQQAVSADTWGFWNASIYNAENGGPLSGDSGYVFSNNVTMAEFRQRWVYILSRWAYSTSIFSWELENESEDWPGGYSDDALAASIEFTALIRANDPYDHMIDNSFGGVPGQSGNAHVWESLISTAFTSVHSYNMQDVAECVWTTVTPHTAALQKPCFLEEFGTDWHGPLQHKDDPAGVGLHTGAWASLVGLGAGGAMQWFWAEMDTLNTYGRLSGAATMSRAIGPQLLLFNWSTWNEGSTLVNSSGVKGGWTIAIHPTTGSLKAVVSWVYDANYTQLGCGNGCEMSTHAGTALQLVSLPLPDPGQNPTIAWVNTTTGAFIPPPRGTHIERAIADAAATARAQGRESVDILLPFVGEFVSDAALWCEWT